MVLCAGAPDTPEIAAEMRKKVDEARSSHPRIVWIEKMVTQAGGDQLYSNCARLLLPLGLRALRHHQPRGHGLPRAGCRQRHGRHQRGRRRRRDRLPGPVRSGPGDQFSARSGKVCARSGGAHQQSCSATRRSAGALAMQVGGASKRCSAGQQLRTRPSSSTRS